MSPMFHPCEDCGGERLFEQQHQTPGSCPDSPDGQCPEWLCTDCGAALFAAAWAGAAGTSREAGAAGQAGAAGRAGAAGQVA